MGLNPLDTSNIIFNRYKNYITTSLKFNDEGLNQQLLTNLNSYEKFSKGPIIEITPPYKTGKSILDLIEENILTSDFRKFKSESLPLERSLYVHQERAIRKICYDQKNLVVATGTGSGKTESFMIPILNELIKERQNRELGPGVRALLLYPMNALANDQMKRLRKYLKNQTDITFGIYTGETENSYEKAYDKFVRMHGTVPLENELISREQMKAEPPHILLTNYAMLEYLMLRPDDSVFFEGEYSNRWKYIVIDEAHTYTGAKGIEMSLLLARLKATIGLEKGSLRCILTSASLGSGREDHPKVAEFASKLFQEDFTCEDVIDADKEEIKTGQAWGRPDPKLYAMLMEKIEKNYNDDIDNILLKNGVPRSIVEEAKFNNTYLPKGLIFDCLKGDKNILNTINLLSKGPRDLSVLAKNIFPSELNRNSIMTNLVDLCNLLRKSEESNALMPARYHYFVKALEGAYLTISDRKKLYLNRMNEIIEEDMRLKAFEVGTCSKCNSIYLIGETLKDEKSGLSYLIENQNRYIEEGKGIEYYAIIDEDFKYEENEDDFPANKNKRIKNKNYRLCTSCGNITKEGKAERCACKKNTELRLQQASTNEGVVHKCSICSALNTRGSVVRRFFLSEDVVSSVLVTALYDQIPNKVIEKENGNEKGKGLFANVTRRRKDDITKQLLVFSDSRQNAAYFASYLKSSYSDLLVRNILVKVIERNKEAFINNNWSIADFQRNVFNLVKEEGLIKESRETIEVKTWRWVVREFFDKGHNSLESTGYIRIVPDYEMIEDFDIILEIGLFREFGLSRDEIFSLMEYIFEDFRYNRAFQYPEQVGPWDEYFEPVNSQGAFCRTNPPSGSKRSKGYNIKSWVPSSSYMNGRLDYLLKITNSKGLKISKEDVRQKLNLLFELFTEQDSPLYKHVVIENNEAYGMIYKLNMNAYKIAPGIKNPRVTYYKCNKCYNITTININNVCPTYRCEGSLSIINMEEVLDNNHYRNLYNQLKLEKMDVSEHTAQLTTEYAAEVQNKFINGEINVLSCSTTFELGVDVGDLETVFMKNIPPTPANYAQRAGRAGRRTNSTAYALTFAKLSSHDFSNYSDPYKMISGIIKPPYFEVENIKIIKRHVYACAFAKFWRLNKDYFSKVKDFFGEKDEKGYILFKQYLDERPDDLLEMIKKIVPENISDDIGVESWAWADEFYSSEGTMTKIIEEFLSDIESLTKAKLFAIERDKLWEANEYNKVINTLESKALISFLSQKNALPKYGFPVDVVPLEVNSHSDESGKIDLTRDLQMAVSEYAPESQVVANGRLWTSKYIKKIRNKELLKYYFESCRCGYFHKKIYSDAIIKSSSCPICGKARLYSGSYMMPEFGFLTDRKSGDPGSIKPKRTYSSRKHFSGLGDITESKDVLIGNNIIKLSSMNHGQLTVLNNGRGRGFFICKKCGFGAIDGIPESHVNSMGNRCKGYFDRVSLGYDFETDILQIDFPDIYLDYSSKDGFWESVMYALIEGISNSLEIDRSDIDGTLYIKDFNNKSLILFDTVPGGAGHVKRLLNKEQFISSIEKAFEIILNCDCGDELADTSCYSCLRNYANQYCHDKMERRFAIKALELLMEKEFAT